jgi:Cu(I)/Ag(I) efflux system periplasmic protein CusF
MNTSKTIAQLIITATTLGLSLSLQASPLIEKNTDRAVVDQSSKEHPSSKDQAPKEPTQPAATMADAEVRKIDLENLKITLKHGEIKNLDMPSMTMVFQMKDAALFKDIKVGDKIKFAAEKQGRNYVVTEVQVVKE